MRDELRIYRIVDEREFTSKWIMAKITEKNLKKQ